MIALLNRLNRVCQLFAECFVFVALDTDRGGLDVVVLRALRIAWVRDRNRLIIFDYHTPPLVHGLIIDVDLLIVTKSRVHFLFDHTLHAGG